MCDVCRMQICPPECPGFDGRREGVGEPIGRCAVCESLIYQGEHRFSSNDCMVCEDCAEYINADELRELCGLSDRCELLIALGFVSEVY